MRPTSPGGTTPLETTPMALLQAFVPQACLLCALLLLAGCVVDPGVPVDDRAQVVSSVPVVVQQQVPVTQQVCESPPPQGANEGGAVVGGLVGGAAGGLAGNQFGKGSGNAAMIALGAVGGAIAGASIGSRYPQQPRNCQQVTSTTTQSYTQFDVTYVWRGVTYRTRMDHDPGPYFYVNQARGY